MKLNSLIAITVTVVLVLSYTPPSRAYIKPSGPPTLSAGYIIFHTKDDDKDPDSYENVTISVGPHRVGTIASSGAGQKWDDQKDTPSLYLDNIDHNIEPTDCDKVHVDINHSTTGNDDWKFSFTVVLTFTDGSSYTYDHPAKETLTKDSGHGAWDIVKNQ